MLHDPLRGAGSRPSCGRRASWIGWARTSVDECLTVPGRRSWRHRLRRGGRRDRGTDIESRGPDRRRPDDRRSLAHGHLIDGGDEREPGWPPRAERRRGIMDLGYEIDVGPDAQEWAVRDGLTGSVGHAAASTATPGSSGRPGMMSAAFRDDCAHPSRRRAADHDDRSTTTTSTVPDTTRPGTTVPDATAPDSIRRAPSPRRVHEPTVPAARTGR